MLAQIKEKLFGSKALVMGLKKQPAIRKNALLSYLRNPPEEELQGASTTQFSNNGAARSWAHVLLGLGYDVDVINWDDVRFKPKKKYDLVVYHGGKNFSNIQKAIKAARFSVYYSTGTYWRYHNKAEVGRFTDFEKRNGVSLDYDRYIDDNEQEANIAADAIISLGNSKTKATYKAFPEVYSIEAASFLDDRFPHTKKNYSEAKKNFLFLSGPGNIHKGLDLILESFRKLPELHLHIMSSLDLDFKQFYHKDLYKSKNVHTYGYIAQRSTQFYEVVDKCAFSVLASCSEGSPGSVIESMQQGLVPLISKESHIDLPLQSMYLTNCKIATIQKAIRELSDLTPNEVERQAELCFEHASKNMPVDSFEKRLADILKEVMEVRE